MNGIPREEIVQSLNALILQRTKLEGAIEILENQLKALDAKKVEEK